MDSQLGRPPEAFKKLASRYVRAWITDMRGVDLERYSFDFDLTFSVLLMNADGTVYHRFGGRDHENATKWVSMKPLIKLLERGLAAHARYATNPRPPSPKPRTIADYPTFARFANGRKGECIHCHQIGEMEVQSAEQAGGFDKETIWRYPSPSRVGLVMHEEEQDLVAEVRPGTAAERAGIAPGDRLVAVGEFVIGSVNDIQAALHAAPPTGVSIQVVYRRAKAERKTRLRLGEGWKTGDALSFSWRALKWHIPPTPGFGGRDLGKASKKELGLDPDRYAFQIGYLVTWGRRGYTGRNAAKAGLRENDIVYAVGGKTDFLDQNHFHAWFRLNAKIGTTMEIKYLRGNQRRVAHLKILE